MCETEKREKEKGEKEERDGDRQTQRESALGHYLDYNLYLSSVFPQCALSESWRGKESSRSVPELPL